MIECICVGGDPVERERDLSSYRIGSFKEESCTEVKVLPLAQRWAISRFAENKDLLTFLASWCFFYFLPCLKQCR